MINLFLECHMSVHCKHRCCIRNKMRKPRGICGCHNWVGMRRQLVIATMEPGTVVAEGRVFRGKHLKKPSHRYEALGHGAWMWHAMYSTEHKGMCILNPPVNPVMQSRLLTLPFFFSSWGVEARRDKGSSLKSAWTGLQSRQWLPSPAA